MTLNHLHLKVLDVKETTVFYGELFGFREKLKFSDDFVFIQNSAGFDLALVQVEEVKQLPDGVHFGFAVSDQNELLEMYRKVQSTFPNSPLSEEPVNKGTWASFTCKDPNGYPVEVYWDSSLH